MAVNETDIELLDTYLDGELPVDACESLWRRMVEDPELATELERCRADRAIRQQVFASMQPTELSVARVESKLATIKHRHDFVSILHKSLTALSTAAACILFGFAVGWLGHNKYPAATPAANSAAQMISAPAEHTNSAKFVVNIQDEAGRIVATKVFNTADEARKFADDVMQSQARHRDVHDSPVVPVSDQF